MANQRKDQRTAPSNEPVSGSVPTTESAARTAQPPITSAAPNIPSSDTENTKLKDSATDLYEHAKETASDSYDAVATKAKTAVEQRKNEFSTGLRSVADSFRQAGGQLQNSPESNRVAEFTSDYTVKAAGAIENVANYFERKDPREMIRDVQGFARRNPAIFFGAAFALGILTARFLKSSKPNEFSRQTSMSPEQLGAMGLPAPTKQPEGGTGMPRAV
ncbi:MAG TPA: hypothetical protein VEV84_08120 [Pyrinomonadaceae bacterium]|nr:hypothetical protein [Pyrinomonadaceae bacterium]